MVDGVCFSLLDGVPERFLPVLEEFMTAFAECPRVPGLPPAGYVLLTLGRMSSVGDRNNVRALSMDDWCEFSLNMLNLVAPHLQRGDEPVSEDSDLKTLQAWGSGGDKGVC
jgi:hypothetical protein